METGYRLKTRGDKTASAIFPMVSLSVAATDSAPTMCSQPFVVVVVGGAGGNVVGGC